MTYMPIYSSSDDTLINRIKIKQSTLLSMQLPFSYHTRSLFRPTYFPPQATLWPPFQSFFWHFLTIIEHSLAFTTLQQLYILLSTASTHFFRSEELLLGLTKKCKGCWNSKIARNVNRKRRLRQSNPLEQHSLSLSHCHLLFSKYLLLLYIAKLHKICHFIQTNKKLQYTSSHHKSLEKITKFHTSSLSSFITPPKSQKPWFSTYHTYPLHHPTTSSYYFYKTLDYQPQHIHSPLFSS